MTQTLTDMKIEKIRLALYNEGTFYKENISVYVSELQFKINEIIDKLNSMEKRIGKCKCRKPTKPLSKSMQKKPNLYKPKQSWEGKIENIIKEEIANYGSGFSPTMIKKLKELISTLLVEKEKEVREEEQKKFKKYVRFEIKCDERLREIFNKMLK